MGRVERREVHFSGRVQGVGFRFTAERIARDYDVTGYVMNLPDGRVRLVAEGTPGELDRLVETIVQTMRPNVRDVQVDVQPSTAEFRDFGIRY